MPRADVDTIILNLWNRESQVLFLETVARAACLTLSEAAKHLHALQRRGLVQQAIYDGPGVTMVGWRRTAQGAAHAARQ